MRSKNHSIIRHENVSTFIPAEKVPQPPATIPPLQVPELPATHPYGTGLAGYARQDDDAMSHARATLLVSAAYIVAAAMITAGLLLLAWLFRAMGDAWGLYALSALIVWGLCILVALWANRRQGLHHSPSGIAHAEISSRERLAMHAINVHARLLLKRWERE